MEKTRQKNHAEILVKTCEHFSVYFISYHNISSMILYHLDIVYVDIGCVYLVCASYQRESYLNILMAGLANYPKSL